jgi:eukaryotic-like serine/threonine-protein kinase
MGVVYKAEDLKLGRRVAIKFLPGELASDPKSLARLESEARAASALDHRNICSIYELDEHEGQPFIVMQLLKGQTLQEQMEAAAQQGAAMPTAKVLAVALQALEGLRAAHEKGFIHRDIKPANIFITDNGDARILDFGLAQSLQGDDEERCDSAVLRVAASAYDSTADHRLRLTMTGTHMGTAFYMSPEQVRGEKLDARTDLFSFGLVLYQMLSGQRAFPGNTTQVVHDGILNNTPISLREINPTLSAKLVATVEKCLEKERERRFQSAAEISSALAGVINQADTASVYSLRRNKITIIAAVVLILAGAILYWWLHRPLTQRAFQSYRMTALTDAGDVALATISPDGRYLAYVEGDFGHQSLWVQQVSTSSKVRILGPVSHPLLQALRFTPDGSYLYYVQEDPDGATQSLYRIPALGGTPQRIVFDVADHSSVDVSPDSKRIVYARGVGTSPNGQSHGENWLLVANADGSGERRVLTLRTESVGLPVWSPDGKTIAFGFSDRGDIMGGVALVPASGGKERRLLQNARFLTSIAWLPDQSGLVISMWPLGANNLSLWTISCSDGNLHKITNDLASYDDLTFAGAGRSLVAIRRESDSTLWTAPASDPTDATPLREGAARADGMWGAWWLPDDRLVYGIGDLSELWLVEADGSHRQQLTNIGNTATNPSAQALGDAIVFTRMDNSTRTTNIWAIDSTGGNLRQLTTGPISKWSPGISPDGKWISYRAGGNPFKMSLANGEVTQLERRWGGDPTISPDGRWIAFEAWDDHIEVVSADGKGVPRYLPFISEPQAPHPNMDFASAFPLRWTADCNAITYMRTKNGVSNLWIQPLDGSPAKQLTHFTSMYMWRHAWSHDGKWVVMSRGNLSRDAIMLTDVR